MREVNEHQLRLIKHFHTMGEFVSMTFSIPELAGPCLDLIARLAQKCIHSTIDIKKKSITISLTSLDIPILRFNRTEKISL